MTEKTRIGINFDNTFINMVKKLEYIKGLIEDKIMPDINVVLSEYELHAKLNMQLSLADDKHEFEIYHAIIYVDILDKSNTVISRMISLSDICLDKLIDEKNDKGYIECTDINVEYAQWIDSFKELELNDNRMVHNLIYRIDWLISHLDIRVPSDRAELLSYGIDCQSKPIQDKLREFDYETINIEPLDKFIERSEKENNDNIEKYRTILGDDLGDRLTLYTFPKDILKISKTIPDMN